MTGSLSDIYLTMTFSWPNPPATIRRGYSRHDFEWPFKFYEDGGPNLPRVCNKDGTPKLHNGQPYGLPEVIKLKSGSRIKLYEPLERFWYRLFELRLAEFGFVLTEEEKHKEWLDLTDDAKAFTNKKGSKTCRSFVAGTNSGEEPMGKESVDCLGNVYWLAGDPVTKVGDLCYPIWALDVTKPLPDPAVIYPVKELVHDAVVCRPEQVVGGYRCDPFPYRAPVPLFAETGDTSRINGFDVRVDWILASRIRELAVGENPNPFVPPR